MLGGVRVRARRQHLGRYVRSVLLEVLAEHAGDLAGRRVVGGPVRPGGAGVEHVRAGRAARRVDSSACYAIAFLNARVAHTTATIVSGTMKRYASATLTSVRCPATNSLPASTA